MFAIVSTAVKGFISSHTTCGIQEAGKDGRGRWAKAENRNADKDPEPVRALREPMGPLQYPVRIPVVTYQHL
jgi:hypothetical protein